MEMDGKVGLVTGAGGGIGEATAQLLAARGATVVAADITSPSANQGGGRHVAPIHL